MTHLSVQKYSVEYETQFKRLNYSTPKNYLDFINSYSDNLANFRKYFEQLVMRLEGGLNTL